MAASRRIAPLLLVLAVIAVGCSGNDERPTDAKNPEEALHAEVASYDIAAGEKSRLLVGLFTGDELFVSYGTVDMSFAFLGEGQASATPEPGPSATGEFLLVPETESPADPPERPIAAPASRGRGVYAAQVNFDRPGFWEVTVRVDVEGRGQLVATGAFEVLEEHRVGSRGARAEDGQPHARLGGRTPGGSRFALGQRRTASGPGNAYDNDRRRNPRPPTRARRVLDPRLLRQPFLWTDNRHGPSPRP
ncbi:MAG: hypothetical protein M3280_05360 [Actinomycetota bacterium]|nr:hypothetical protein [Actinomycetota bacterium]